MSKDNYLNSANWAAATKAGPYNPNSGYRFKDVTFYVENPPNPFYVPGCHGLSLTTEGLTSKYVKGDYCYDPDYE